MSDDEFTRLYKYLSKEFNEIRAQLGQMALKQDVDRLTNAVDAFAKRMEVYDHERLALGHKVDRHEKWHEQTAKAVGIKLTA